MANLAMASLTKGGAPVVGAGPHPAAPKTAAGKAAGHRAGAAPYNPLQPLTQQQITSQARNTVSAAYKPVYTSLNQQSDQAQNIYNKQSQDNQYFQNWLDSKTHALQAQQATVDQTTNALTQQITGNMQNQATVNQPAGSALAQNLSATNAANQQEVAGATNLGLALERNAEAQQGAASVNAGNFLQAGAQKETANFQNAETKIGAARNTELDKQAADTAKEIARLQGVNINVAENNRNYQTAAAKLGITAAETQSLITNRAANTKVAQQNATTNAAKAAAQLKQNSFDNWIKTQNLDLAGKKFILDQINSNSQIALRNAQIYKDQHGGGTLTNSEQNTIYSVIDKTKGELQSLMGQGLSRQQAYQAIQRGYYLGTEPYQSTTTTNGKTKNTTGSKSVKINVTQVPNAGYLNAAYNLLPGGGGLTQGDVAYLQKLGLADPLVRYGQTNATGSPSTPNYGTGGAGGT